MYKYSMNPSIKIRYSISLRVTYSLRIRKIKIAITEIPAT